MEQYRTEEEQVEALRRWWNENGRSTVLAIAVALAAGFGWQAWQANSLQQREQASDLYQAMLRAAAVQQSTQGSQQAVELAEQIKSEFASTSYAQFAALHLAAMAVGEGDLAGAEAQLRWVLGKAPGGSDTAQVAQLRLARVLAAAGDVDQALDILSQADSGPYAASYAVAQGDILLAVGKHDVAREAYSQALALSDGASEGVNLSVVRQKLQSLSPVPPRAVDLPATTAPVATVPSTGTTDDTTDDTPEE